MTHIDNNYTQNIRTNILKKEDSEASSQLANHTLHKRDELAPL